MDKSKLLGMYQKMIEIRYYEEAIYYLFLEGLMPGSIHQSHGQEACAVGMLYDLRDSDYMASTHRPAGHDIAKGMSIQSLMNEMFAKANGCCRGKGGAMHTGDIDLGIIPANAIVGGNIPIAAGLGMALKLKKKDDVVVCFFGDGASNEGAFHEGLNGAALWNLPVIYVCENNQYGASTSIHATMKIDTIAERGAAYGMPSERIDGNDVIAVNEAATKAIERARTGGGPTLIELMTYRIAGHSRSDSCAYRTDIEESEWFSRDPIQLLRTKLINEFDVTEEELSKMESKTRQDIDNTVEIAQNSPDPLPEDALKDIYWEERTNA